MPFSEREEQFPELIREERKQTLLSFLGVALIFALSYGIQWLLAPLVKVLFPTLVTEYWFLTLYGSFCMYGIAMPCSLLAFRYAKKLPPKETALSFVGFLALLSLAFSLTLVGSLVGTVANLLYSFITGNPAVNPIQELTEQLPLWATVLVTVILAPFFEEFFFRKILIDRLKRYGELFSILLSGVLFGLIHGNLSQFFYAAFLGILFGFVYVKTGKLRYTVALHMTINSIGGVFSTLMLKELQPVIDGSSAIPSFNGIALMAAYLFIYGAALLGLPFALHYLLPKCKTEPGVVLLTRSSKCKVFLLNPGTWVLAAVVVLLWFL